MLIRSDVDLWKIARCFQALAPGLTSPGLSPELWHCARYLALHTLRHETGFHVTPARGLA